MEIVKKVFIILVLLLISSCSSIENKRKNFQKIIALVSANANETDLIEISKDDVENINYPLIQVRTNDVLKHAVMLPISNRNGYTNFLSGSNQSITLHGTMITKTNGLNANLISLEMKLNSPLIKKTPLTKWPLTSSRKYTFITPDHRFRDVFVNCVLEFVKNEKITTLKNNSFSTSKYKEVCNNKNIYFENFYWADKEGFIWKSKQWISEKQVFANLTVLKL